MEGKYPIIIDGALLGELKVYPRGAMTVFEARTRVREGVLRLSVYGDGREGYLGVLAPEEGEMRLRRALSPAAMRDFPTQIDEVGPAGGIARDGPAMEEKEPGKPEKAEIPADVYWYSSPDGALVAFDGEHSLIALPAGDERVPKDVAGERRTVEGREYTVYVTKDGRIIS